MAQPLSKVRSLSYSPRVGYSLVAQQYEAWHWFQFWQRNERPIVEQWANSVYPGLLLDAGSGTGLYRQALEQAGHTVISVDASPEMLAVQKDRHPTAITIAADILELPFPDSCFDYLLCTRVLSHIAKLEPALSEFARVTKPTAELLLADVHPNHRYSDMSVPLNGERISIETYKHPVEEIKSAIRPPLRLLDFHEYRLQDLTWKPPAKSFENIYDAPDRPIFYVALLRRQRGLIG